MLSRCHFNSIIGFIGSVFSLPETFFPFCVLTGMVRHQLSSGIGNSLVLPSILEIILLFCPQLKHGSYLTDGI